MGKKPKIAFVSNDSWGLYNFRMGVIRKLRELGYEIIIIAGEDNYTRKIRKEGFNFYPANTNVFSTNPVNEIKFLWQLYKLYRKTKPDFIFHYTIKPNIYGTMVAAMLRIPSVSIVAGLGLLANHEKSNVMFIARNLYRITARFSKELWFLNQVDRKFFKRKIVFAKNKLHVLPGEGIDLERFHPSPYKNSEGKIAFIFAGRMLWAKGLKELAIAAKEIKNKYPGTTFQLLGFFDPTNPNSVSREQIESWHKTGLFEYLGETEDVIPFLQNADCIILPSYREGISRLLLEASALGKPSIASDVVGCREIVEHGKTGFLCKPKNSEDLIKAIEDFILLSPDAHKQMGINARKKVEQEFDEKIVINEYIKTLEKYKISL